MEKSDKDRRDTDRSHNHRKEKKGKKENKHKTRREHKKEPDQWLEVMPLAREKPQIIRKNTESDDDDVGPKPSSTYIKEQSQVQQEKNKYQKSGYIMSRDRNESFLRPTAQLAEPVTIDRQKLFQVIC
jgi:flavin-dependent dehydrogenase